MVSKEVNSVSVGCEGIELDKPKLSFGQQITMVGQSCTDTQRSEMLSYGPRRSVLGTNDTGGHTINNYKSIK